MQTSLSYQQQNSHHHHHHHPHHRQHEKHLYYLSNEPHDADHELTEDPAPVENIHSHDSQEHHRSDCEINYDLNGEFVYQDGVVAHNDERQQHRLGEQVQYACDWDQQHKITYQDCGPQVYQYQNHLLTTADSEQQFGAAIPHVESTHHEHVAAVELVSSYESRAIDLSHHETSTPAHIYYDLSSVNVNAQPAATRVNEHDVNADAGEAAHHERTPYTNGASHHHDSHYSQLYSYPTTVDIAATTNSMIEPLEAIQHAPHQTFVEPSNQHDHLQNQHHHHQPSCHQNHLVLESTYNQTTSPHQQYAPTPYDHTDYNNLANLYDNSKHEPENGYQVHQQDHQAHRTTGDCYSAGEQSISQAYHPMHQPSSRDNGNDAVGMQQTDVHKPPEQVCASSNCAASGTPAAGTDRSHSAALSSVGGSGRLSSSSSSSCDLLDSDLESIDSQLTRDEKKAREANIPLSYHAIVNLSIEQFNEHIVRYPFSEAQLTLMKDIRRRGKNKVAAQTCRKRKMEQISELQLEVAGLANKRAALSCERSRLSREHARLSSEYERLYETIQGYLVQAGGELKSAGGEQQQQQQQQALIEQNSNNFIANVS